MKKTLSNNNSHHRIAIVGNASAGKTTFARKLGCDLALPVFHIDDLQYSKVWQRKTALEFKKSHTKLMGIKNWIIDGVGREKELYVRLYKANVIIFIDLPIEEHLSFAKSRENAPTETAPEGCSYEGMFDRVEEIIVHLDKTLIPKLRKDIPSIAKHTKAFVCVINHIDEIENIRETLIKTLVEKRDD